MKKWLLTAGLVALVIAVSTLAVRAYTGQMITREVTAWENAIARDPALLGDHIQVRHLRYEPGLFRGELHYDVSVGVPDGHPILDALRVAYPELRTARLPLRGTAEVTQGPLFGREHGIVLAELNRSVALDSALAAILPDSRSGDGINVIASLYADGTVRGQLSASDYIGAWQGLEDSQAELALAGLNGQFFWQPDDWSGGIGATLDSLALDHQDMALDLEQVTLELDIEQEGNAQWRNHNVFTVNRGHLITHNTNVQTVQFQADTTIRHTNGRIGHQVALTMGDTVYNQWRATDGRVNLMLDNLDAEAYLTLLEQLADGASGGGFPPSQRMRLLATLEQLLDTGPTLRIEQLALSLAQSDDIMASLRAQYPEEASVDFASPADMLDQLALQLSAIVDTSAIRQISQWRAEADARELMATRGLERSPEQIQRMAATHYRTSMLTLQFMPLVTVSGGKAETHLELRNGDIYRNDERVMPVTQILRMFGM